MERLSKSAFKLRSGNKPSPMELSGVSPMKDKNPKILSFRTWKNEIWNKDNSYGPGLELPDSQARPDYEEYVASENEKAGFETDSKGRATKQIKKD
tara:strand:- start:64 stop:351 length:288 start_codon:yes stop_codon:yes gene_type:complete